MQLDQAEKGFSFMRKGPLDMRMDKRGELTAADIVNTYDEVEIARIIYEYGEEHRSRPIARAICERRKTQKFETTTQLAETIASVVGRGGRGGKLHPATLTFQALRIAVNDELGVLKRGLEAALGKLSVGGRMAVISFHRLEDRIVKALFQEHGRIPAHEKRSGEMPMLKILTKKPLIAKRDEVLVNRRSRSAKLRLVEKLK